MQVMHFCNKLDRSSLARISTLI